MRGFFRSSRLVSLAAALLVAGLMVTTGASTVSAAGAKGNPGASGPLESHPEIIITSDKEFDAEHGVRSGKGTKENPYVISGWSLPALLIQNTGSWVTIKNNDVSGTMVIDWIGHGTRVVNNNIGDLRVNQNVARTGMMTDGVIAENKIRVVGQLRHWDGVFENNIVGSENLVERQPEFRAVNFDGFNGAQFRNNTIYGYVDVKLHGHHHSSRFGNESHDHAGEMSAEDVAHAHHSGPDHTRRYHELFFHDNEIHSDYSWALRYYDRAHAGDDRTAASEQNKFLNCPHWHFTRVHLEDNQLFGSGLLVDVFNAPDENHWGTKTGYVEIRNNDIQLERDARELLGARYGITVQEAVDLNLDIVGNNIKGPNQLQDDNEVLLNLEKKLNKGAGIWLNTIDQAQIHLDNNDIQFRTYGILANTMTKAVDWWISGLSTTGVDEQVHYEGVINPPKRRG